MNRFLVVQVMLWLCAASIAAQPTGQEAVEPSEIDSRAVWNIRDNTDAWDRLRECGRDAGYLDCVAEVMRQAGASPQAIAVTRLLEGDVFISSFRGMGRVDLADAFNPFMANSNDRFLLVNGTPRVLDVGGSLDLDGDDLRRDPLYPSFRRRYPDLTIGGYPAFEETQPLRTGGQRFIFRFQLVNGCRACWANGYASVAYDFDETGRFGGTTFLRIIRARPDGTPISSTSARPKGRNRAQSSLPSFIALQHEPVLQTWLASRPGWRPATKEDSYIGVNKDAYDFIESQMRDLGRHPYYVEDDFNGDGHQDFAIILIRKIGRGYKYAVAIFNGPFGKTRKATPTFYSEQVGEGDWLFWMKGDEFGSRFIVGAPASDAGYIIRPRGRGYVIE